MRLTRRSEAMQHDQDSSHFLATTPTGEAVGTVRIHNITGQVCDTYCRMADTLITAAWEAGCPAPIPRIRSGSVTVRSGARQRSGERSEGSHGGFAGSKTSVVAQEVADGQAEEPRDARGFYRKLGYVPRGDIMTKEGGESDGLCR